MKTLLRLYYILEFALYYLVNLLQANLLIAWDIISPTLHTRPGFVKVDLRLRTDTGLLLFSNLVSMTPGTLVTDVSGDKKSATVHVLYMQKKEQILEQIDDIQKRIARITEQITVRKP
ncbi:MAG: Na+/H+ antiporter subunit E [Bacteroidales bacterium]